MKAILVLEWLFLFTMIQYNPKNWFSLILSFHKSDTLKKLSPVLVMYAILTFVVVYIELHHKEWFTFKSTTQIHSLLGFVIGLLLVFRTNSAYDRWWEGRKQWGSIVNNARNLAIKINAFLPIEDRELRNYFSAMISNYVFAFKEHLREGVNWNELTFIEDFNKENIKDKTHVPNIIASKIYGKINLLHKQGKITGDQLINIDKEIKAFTDILGACERIKNTPMPYSYSMFLKKFIFVYTITIPLGMAYDFNYWTIPIATSILYVLASLELLAEEIEDPFGKDVNDLPIDELSGKIKANVEEILHSPS